MKNVQITSSWYPISLCGKPSQNRALPGFPFICSVKHPHASLCQAKKWAAAPGCSRAFCPLCLPMRPLWWLCSLLDSLPRPPSSSPAALALCQSPLHFQLNPHPVSLSPCLWSIVAPNLSLVIHVKKKLPISTLLPAKLLYSFHFFFFAKFLSLLCFLHLNYSGPEINPLARSHLLSLLV